MPDDLSQRAHAVRAPAPRYPRRGRAGRGHVHERRWRASSPARLAASSANPASRRAPGGGPRARLAARTLARSRAGPRRSSAAVRREAGRRGGRNLVRRASAHTPACRTSRRGARAVDERRGRAEVSEVDGGRWKAAMRPTGAGERAEGRPKVSVRAAAAASLPGGGPRQRSQTRAPRRRLRRAWPTDDPAAGSPRVARTGRLGEAEPWQRSSSSHPLPSANVRRRRGRTATGARPRQKRFRGALVRRCRRRRAAAGLGGDDGRLASRRRLVREPCRRV